MFKMLVLLSQTKYKTIGQYANEDMIINYVKNQCKKYNQLHKG